MQALDDLCTLLLSTYPAIDQLLGHDEIAVGRKQDPGPAFPMQHFRNRLLPQRSENSTLAQAGSKATVTVPYLNIRELPRPDAARVRETLKHNTELTVLDSYKNWLKVEHRTVGWVAAEYVKG